MDRVIYESSKRITSGFRTKNRPRHNGVDLGWRANEEYNIVYSNSRGVVVAVQTGQKTQLASAGTYGNYVKVDHQNGYYSLYAHLREVYVKKGQVVDENTRLGIEGTTGATGVMKNGKIVGQRHLHFEVFKGTTKIDPTPYLTKSIYTPKVEPAPTPSDGITYIVKRGDTLSAIAKRYNTTYPKLAEYNGIPNPNKISVGQVIKIPLPYLTKAIAENEPERRYTGNLPTLPARSYFKNGDRGANVKLLQKLLNWINNDKLVVDGIIGPKTIASVKKFQKNYGLAVDGLFGKKSLAKAKELV